MAGKGSFFGMLVSCAWLIACGNCDDEYEAAERFLLDPENLGCQTASDCQVVSTGCRDIGRGICSQALLNKEVAGSQAWREHAEAINECEEDNSCKQCLAELAPTCSQGFCGGPPG